MENILIRIERLERENRRWRGLALLAIAVLAGAGAIQKQGTTTLTGTSMYLHDAAGKPRVVATATEAKGAMLAFMDEQGVTRLRIGLVGKETRIETWDERKQTWHNFVAPGGVIPLREP